LLTVLESVRLTTVPKLEISQNSTWQYRTTIWRVGGLRNRRLAARFFLAHWTNL